MQNADLLPRGGRALDLACGAGRHALLLAAAGCNYFMGVPCADDVMLNYQSTSYHDAASVRKIFGLRPAPEFLSWLEEDVVSALMPGR